VPWMHESRQSRPRRRASANCRNLPPPYDSQAICAPSPRFAMICAPRTRDRGWWRVRTTRVELAAVARSASTEPLDCDSPSWVPLLPVRRCRVARGYFRVPAGTYPAPDALARMSGRPRGQRARMRSTRERAGTRGYHAVPARHGVSQGVRRTGYSVSFHTRDIGARRVHQDGVHTRCSGLIGRGGGRARGAEWPRE
jgi:hypothetical protein